MAFIPIVAALIAAAASTGSAISASNDQANAQAAQAKEAAKQRAFEQAQSLKNSNEAATSNDLGNVTQAGSQAQGEYAKAVNTIQGAAQQRQQELEGVSDSIAKNLTGMGH